MLQCRNVAVARALGLKACACAYACTLCFIWNLCCLCVRGGRQLIASVWMSYQMVWPSQAQQLLKQLAFLNMDVLSIGAFTLA